MRYSNTHKQETHDQLLRAAARSLRLHGPEGIGVNKIMAQAGLTRGGFYAHFGSRDMLVAEAIDAVFEDVKGRFFDRAPAGTDPHVELNDIISGYVSPKHRDMREQGCPLPILSADMARMEPQSRERFGTGVANAITKLAELLARIGVPDAHMAATAALSEMVGALALSRSVADPAQSDDLLKQVRKNLRQRFGLKRPT
jgi:TetR/AcrR family transcriptional regulator, transcriptional repressor for nem operon